MKILNNNMILILINFFISDYSSTYDEELKRIVQVDLVEKVDS